MLPVYPQNEYPSIIENTKHLYISIFNVKYFCFCPKVSVQCHGYDFIASAKMLNIGREDKIQYFQ